MLGPVQRPVVHWAIKAQGWQQTCCAWGPPPNPQAYSQPYRSAIVPRLTLALTLVVVFGGGSLLGIDLRFCLRWDGVRDSACDGACVVATRVGFLAAAACALLATFLRASFFADIAPPVLLRAVCCRRMLREVKVQLCWWQHSLAAPARGPGRHGRYQTLAFQGGSPLVPVAVKLLHQLSS